MIFKNVHIRDERIIKEVYKYTAFKQPFMVAMICAFLFITAFELGLILSGRSNDPTVPVLAAFCLLYTYYKYRKTVKTTVNRNREDSGGEDIIYTTTVTKKNITTTTSTGEKYRLEYSDIKRCGISGDLIIVLSKNSTAYIFTTDGFEVGTAKGFIQFLKDRGVKITGSLS